MNEGEPVRVPSEEARERAIEVFRELLEGQREMLELTRQTHRMVWEIGNRMFGRQQGIAPKMPITPEQVRAGKQFVKDLRAVINAFFNPKP